MTYDDMTLRELAGELILCVDADTYCRLHACEIMERIAELLDALDFRKVDWTDLGPIGEAAHWFVTEGTRDESMTAMGLFEPLQDGHNRARIARVDEWLKTGVWK